ncbi:MAG: 5-formyltetrahydrofolate cyclo-ligase [Marinibacterium sp.]
MTGTADAKAALRKAAFARRKAAHAAAAPGGAALLSGVLAGHQGAPLAGYMPIRTEIDPLPAMAEAAAHRQVGVPVIVGAGQPLVFSHWTPGGALRDGPFGVKVPQEDRFLRPEVLIVPLVAFDAAGGRLGYGGGYYDRTLERLRKTGPVLAIGFAYDAQEVDRVPREVTDQKLDMIVTETRVLTV